MSWSTSSSRMPGLQACMLHHIQCMRCWPLNPGLICCLSKPTLVSGQQLGDGRGWAFTRLGWRNDGTAGAEGRGLSPSDRIGPPLSQSLSQPLLGDSQWFCCQPSSIRPPITRFCCFLFLLVELHFPQTILSWHAGRWGQGCLNT